MANNQQPTGDAKLAEWLRKSMDAADLTQQAVADQAYMTRSKIAMMLNCKRGFTQDAFETLYSLLGGDDFLPDELWTAPRDYRTKVVVSDYRGWWGATPYTPQKVM